jgi:hypothetical protein
MHVSVVTIGEVEQLPCVLDDCWSILGLTTIVVEGTKKQGAR